MGGVGGLRFGGGYGAAVGAPIGGYYGGRVYDQQIAPRSYYPRYMGTQTTTAYWLVPRHGDFDSLVESFG
jgi:hypothetical protein